MVCVYCGTKTGVSNSRHQRRTNSVWRRRECPNCGGVVTTQEVIKLESAVLVSSTTSVQPFQRDRLWLSVHDSLGHRKQPVEDATGLTDTIIGRLLPQIEQAKLERNQIVRAATEVLQHFDRAAATHYQAYHPL